MTEQNRNPPLLRRVETRRRSALRLLNSLAKASAIRHDMVHEVRVDLRRLQAWLELIGDRPSSAKLGAAVSLASPARTFHVFEEWLTRQEAPPSDLQLVRRGSREADKKLARGKVFETIRQILGDLRGWERSPSFPRQRKVWQVHAASLKLLLTALRKNPKRKRLHALRLELKQLRYQLEWITPRTDAHSKLLGRLRQAQRTLGTYEERAAFRNIAKQLRLKSRPIIVKRWRRARKNARALPRNMNWLLPALHRLAHKTAPSQLASGRSRES